MPGRGRPFAEGKSGNPGGRPKALKDIEALARKYTPAAIEALVAALTGKDRVAAANALLDRGWGKAKQLVEIEGDVAMRVICETPLTESEWQEQFGRKDAPAPEAERTKPGE